MNLAKIGKMRREQFEDYCRLRCCAYPISPDKALCRILGQFPFYADMGDVSQGPHLVADGFWESWLTLAMLRTVKTGWNCLDVGANHGYFTVLLSKLAGPTGSVLAFEPCTRTFGYLQENIRINGCANVETFNAAVGAKKERAKLTWKTSNPTSASLLPPAAHLFRAEESGEEVLVTPLDFLEAAKFDFIKIDAEGLDYEVLHGAKSLLARNPKCLTIYEHAGHLLGDRAEQLLSEVLADGYSLRLVADDGAFQPITAAQVLAEADRSWNLVLSRPA